MAIDAKRIGKRIKKVRQAQEIKQSVLADSCGICETYLSYIESGTRVPSLEVIDKIASAQTDARDKPLENIYILGIKPVQIRGMNP